MSRLCAGAQGWHAVGQSAHQLALRPYAAGPCRVQLVDGTREFSFYPSSHQRTGTDFLSSLFAAYTHRRKGKGEAPPHPLAAPPSTAHRALDRAAQEQLVSPPSSLPLLIPYSPFSAPCVPYIAIVPRCRRRLRRASLSTSHTYTISLRTTLRGRLRRIPSSRIPSSPRITRRSRSLSLSLYRSTPRVSSDLLRALRHINLTSTFIPTPAFLASLRSPFPLSIFLFLYTRLKRTRLLTAPPLPSPHLPTLLYVPPHDKKGPFLRIRISLAGGLLVAACSADALGAAAPAAVGDGRPPAARARLGRARRAFGGPRVGAGACVSRAVGRWRARRSRVARAHVQRSGLDKRR